MNEDIMNGAFGSSLKRTNKNIKADRADAITEDTEMTYNRMMEDLAMQIKRKNRERNNMLDLSPTNAQSLIVANDFDSLAFADKDLKLGIEIRELEIKLEIARNRYYFLFKQPDVPEVETEAKAQQ